MRDGDAARSTELTHTGAFAAAALAAWYAAPVCAGSAGALVAAAAEGARAAPAGALPVLVAAACAPAAAAAFAAATITVAQGGGVHLKFPRFEMSRMSPAAGLKRMAGAEALTGAARAVLAFGLVLLALVPAVRELVMSGTAASSPAAAALMTARAAARSVEAALAAGALFAVADLALVRRGWLRRLRMTHDEIRREARENEGDPHTRSRRRGLHRRVIAGAIARTREASFVVVNPTHVAVALRYAPPAFPVPEVLVRAIDAAALQVRAIARAHAIPLVESPALARRLYRDGEPGRPIPADSYVAVAQVVASLARAGLLR